MNFLKVTKSPEIIASYKKNNFFFNKKADPLRKYQSLSSFNLKRLNNHGSSNLITEFLNIHF